MMLRTTVQFLWHAAGLPGRYRTGVSIHSHTLHSRECLDFLPTVTKAVPFLTQVLDYQQQRYRRLKGVDLDLTRAWWTPPLSARQAVELEAAQIRDRLQLEPLVSITDHDNLDAPISLQLLEDRPAPPLSFEWTVPFQGTFFHLGIHNLPAAVVRSLEADLAEYTASPSPERLPELLETLHSYPEVLVVFNHPLWDEKRVGGPRHEALVRVFIRRYRSYLHAIELNGLRPWSENQSVSKLAAAAGLPAISGGDRHGLEPNACINLTKAQTFDEFVAEVRGGLSHLLFMPQYQESFSLRMIQNIADVLADLPAHSMGWSRWSDRMFYECEDGQIRSLSDLWGKGGPSVVRAFAGLMQMVQNRRLRSALRLALPQREELVL